MNPDTVNSRDYGLYYNGTFMHHQDMGVVSVRADHGLLQVRKNRKSRWKAVPPETLSCIWPSPRAINYIDTAIYVGRRARREARRSATSNHYYVQWSDRNYVLDSQILQDLCFPPEYPSIDFAVKALNFEERRAIAISRDLILKNTGTKNRFEIICVGHAAGQIVANEQGFQPDPGADMTPAFRRALFKLEKGGLLCQC